MTKCQQWAELPECPERFNFLSNESNNKGNNDNSGNDNGEYRNLTKQKGKARHNHIYDAAHRLPIIEG